MNFQSASVFGITQANGTPGLILDPGEQFRVDLVNGTDEDTIIHWHGQRAPYLQDGVADRNVPLLLVRAAEPGGAAQRLCSRIACS